MTLTRLTSAIAPSRPASAISPLDCRSVSRDGAAGGSPASTPATCCASCTCHEARHHEVDMQMPFSNVSKATAGEAPIQQVTLLWHNLQV